MKTSIGRWLLAACFLLTLAAGRVFAAAEPAAPETKKSSEEETPPAEEVPPPANWKPAGVVNTPAAPVETAPGAAAPGDPNAPAAPPPEGWRSAGEIVEPPPEIGPDGKKAYAEPMFRRGDFTLNLHGRVQLIGGVVGEDSIIENGDRMNRDGFRLTRVRLGLDGRLLQTVEYQLEAELIDKESGGNALFEAQLTYRPTPFAYIRAGAGKPPYSRLLLASSGSLQFVDRPVWVTLERATDTLMLDLDRQVGVTVGGRIGPFGVDIGAYNGLPNFSVGNLHDGLLYVVRLTGNIGEIGRTEADHARSDLRLAAGLNGYVNDAPASQIRGAGADLSLKWKGLSFYAEALWAKSVPQAAPSLPGGSTGETERWGMTAQAGYLMPISSIELEAAVRFAILDDNVHLDNEGDLWTLEAGINAYFYGEAFKLMLNYVHRQERHGVELDNDAVLGLVQVKF